MKYLKIPGWDKWQTFRNDRATPPWIKLHRNLFSNPEWIQLTDQEKGQLVSMWIAAADKKGKISSDPDFIRKMCLLDSPPNLQRFKDLGFLDGTLPTEEDDSMTTTSQPQTENVTKQSRVEESRVEDKNTLSDDKPVAPHSRENFETAWDAYPEKKGKEKAYRHFKAQVTTDQDYINLGIAMVNYIQDVGNQRNNGHPDLMWKHGATFFNQHWKDYIDYNPPPKKVYDGIQPREGDQLNPRVKDLFQQWQGEGDDNIIKLIREKANELAQDSGLNKNSRNVLDFILAEPIKTDELIEGTG